MHKSCLQIKIGNHILFLLLSQIITISLCTKWIAKWITSVLNWKDDISIEIQIKQNNEITDNLIKRHAKWPLLWQATSTPNLKSSKICFLIYERGRKLKASQTSMILDSNCVWLKQILFSEIYKLIFLNRAKFIIKHKCWGRLDVSSVRRTWCSCKGCKFNSQLLLLSSVRTCTHVYIPINIHTHVDTQFLK